MAYGLQIWDESGNLIMDTTTNAGRIIGSFIAVPALNTNGNSYSGADYSSTGYTLLPGVIASGNLVSNGSTTISGFSQGTPWWTSSVTSTFYDRGNTINISVSGTTMSWTITRPDTDEGWADYLITYGVL